MRRNGLSLLTLLLLSFVTGTPSAFAAWELGPETLIQSSGLEIAVSGYSVPSTADWNEDGLPDLIVGEGGGTVAGKVRVYLNTGAPGSPAFSGSFYAQSGSGDLSVAPSGCMGAFPRIVQWDGDGNKDLLVGLADGTVRIYLNTGTNAAPTFDAGTFVQVGQPGAKANIDVGSRATSTVVDWNNDARKDLVIGGLDGKIHLFLNEGTDTAPDFRVETFAQHAGADLLVSAARSSPSIWDIDGDGRKDLITGDTNGHVLFFSNTGSDASPSFNGYSLVTSDGLPIDLAGTPRSRPFVCDWTGDGRLDLLLGSGDGKVRLYQGIPEPATLALVALGVLAFRRR